MISLDFLRKFYLKRWGFLFVVFAESLGVIFFPVLGDLNKTQSCYSLSQGAESDGESKNSEGAKPLVESLIRRHARAPKLNASQKSQSNEWDHPRRRSHNKPKFPKPRNIFTPNSPDSFRSLPLLC